MIEVHVKCPNCGRSLMCEGHKLDGHPGIKVIIEFNDKRCDLYLSSLYGSYNIDCEYLIPMSKIARFFCVECEKEIKGTRVCEICQAPMIPLYFVEGGVLQFCSRRGCKRHLMEFENTEQELRAFYETYRVK